LKLPQRERPLQREAITTRRAIITIRREYCHQKKIKGQLLVRHPKRERWINTKHVLLQDAQVNLVMGECASSMVQQSNDVVMTNVPIMLLMEDYAYLTVPKLNYAVV
jgi:hypothetical protein